MDLNDANKIWESTILKFYRDCKRKSAAERRLHEGKSEVHGEVSLQLIKILTKPYWCSRERGGVDPYKTPYRVSIYTL